MFETADVRTSIVTCTRAAERMSRMFVTLAVSQVTVGHAVGGKQILVMTLYVNVVMKIKFCGVQFAPHESSPS